VSHPRPSLLAQRYQLSRPLGEGSFAETFLATDTLLQRQVAVKILRDQYAHDPRYATRFAREAQAAAAVAHPHVVEVYDHGQDGATLFIVMEWVDGSNLKQLIRDQAPLPIPEALRLLRELLQGLGAIHQAGIIHRDVKPQNVLLTKAGRVKLTDFGIARGTVASSLTETGMALGTAAYMAPEQASGKPVGPGADLYAAGVILFELVTGRLPFEGENPVEVMYRQVHEAVPRPGELNRAIGAELEGVLLQALAKEPEARYPTAEALAALGEVAAAEAARFVPTVPVEPVEHQTAFDSPTRDAPPSPPAMAKLPSPAAWAAGILVAFSLVGLLLLASFLGSGDRASVNESTPSISPTTVVTSSVPPRPSSSAAPAEPPKPSPTLSLTPTPAPSPIEEPPAVVPESPSQAVIRIARCRTQVPLHTCWNARTRSDRRSRTIFRTRSRSSHRIPRGSRLIRQGLFAVTVLNAGDMS
jgi:serine/threonine-protein kinase